MSITASSCPRLGLGLGFRVPHMRDIFASQPEVDFFEIISENFLVDGGPPLANLERLLDRYRVVQHGVSLGIGSSDPLDWDYLQRLKALTKRTGTPWISDHLCWSQHGNAHLHDLLPLPYTPEVAAFVAEKARIVQDYLELPLALENLSSYVAFRASSMSEWQFYTEVCEQADCLMMLDVNNIFVSAHNHDFDPWDYVTAIPWQRVVQMHVAGHSRRDDGTLLDTHDAPVRDEVWELYRYAWKASGGASTILEWDEHFLSFEATWQEAQKARRFQLAQAS